MIEKYKNHMRSTFMICSGLISFLAALSLLFHIRLLSQSFKFQYIIFACIMAENFDNLMFILHRVMHGLYHMSL